MYSDHKQVVSSLNINLLLFKNQTDISCRFKRLQLNVRYNRNVSLNLIMGTFSILMGEFSSCPQEGGFVIHASQPRGPRAAIFWGETITFQKELWGFSFDVGRGYCILQCGRMLRARWSVCACECVHCRARDMVGGTPVKGPSGQTFGCP